MGTIKSGWLQKLSGFFKNSWKRRYFVLYSDGQFCYFQNPEDREPDGHIHMKTECRRIDIAHQVDVKAPKSSDQSAVFSVASPERTWYLVADSEADCRDWVKVLEEARTPLAYSGVPSAMPSNPYPTPAGPPPPYYSQGMPQPAQVPNIAPYPQQGAGQMPPYPPQPPMPYPQPQQVPYPPAGPHPQYPSFSTTSYPPPQQPYPYQGYPPPQPGYSVPTQYPPQQHYPGNMPANYPPQQHHPGTTTYVQHPSQQSHSSGGGKKLLMGAAAGALGGAAMGYMVGNALGGFGHRGYGGWDSDHSWSSGGSFDCDFD